MTTIIAIFLLSLILMHARDERAALLLLLLVGVTAVFGIRKLGYLKYLASDKLIRWVGDVSDDLGIKQGRRKFLSHQMAIFDSSDMEELWSRMLSAAKLMKLDYLELKMESDASDSHTSNSYSWDSGKGKVDPSSLDPNQTMYTSPP